MDIIISKTKKTTELGFDNEERQVGVSAQEVERIMPEVIEKDTNIR